MIHTAGRKQLVIPLFYSYHENPCCQTESSTNTAQNHKFLIILTYKKDLFILKSAIGFSQNAFIMFKELLHKKTVHLNSEQYETSIYFMHVIFCTQKVTTLCPA